MGVGTAQTALPFALAIAFYHSLEGGAQALVRCPALEHGFADPVSGAPLALVVGRNFFVHVRSKRHQAREFLIEQFRI
jgi:hypothetical protein